MEPYADVVSQYEEFAAASGDSPCFEDWAQQVTHDGAVQEWIATLPGIKRQPNLVFAAARWHGVTAPGPYAGLRDALLGDDGTIRATIMERATQTNEVGRLATLTPWFATLEPGPLALLEVGASAGLCLFPDRWSYVWQTDHATVRGGAGPSLSCQVHGPFPAQVRVPEIAWRGGLDLHPLSVSDADQMAWLTNLVWPEQDDRRARLVEAVAIGRADPPHVRTGNLLTDLPDLVEEASAYGTVVVFHSAVIAYLEQSDRELFHDQMTELVAQGRCRWVSNEGKRVLPRVTATGPEVPAELTTFVLGVDGQARAWTHGHGSAMRVL